MPTTAAGTTYTTRTFTTPAGEQALWGIADAHVNSKNVPLVIYCHGNSGPYNQFSTSVPYAGLRNWLIDNGWAWVESAGGGLSSWGNAAARTSYRESFDHVAANLDIGEVVVHGSSMGGLVAYWLYINEPTISAKAVGLIIASGTTDLEARIGAPPGDGSIRNAFGLAADGSDWAAKMSGYDPMKYPLEVWRGKKVLQLYGTDDTTVPGAIHGQAWLDKYSSVCAVADRDVRVGGDHSNTNGSWLQTSAFTAFLNKVAPVREDPPPAADVMRVDRAYLVGANLKLYPLTSVPTYA